MPETDGRQLVLYAVALVAVVLVGARWMGREGPPPRAPAALRVSDSGRSEGGAVVVHVAGAVRRPGVYRLSSGTRVEAAVRRAGGVLRSADLTQLNLAAPLEDGRQVVVPRRGAVAAGVQAGPLNLNTATVDQLDELDGVGPATAQRIVDYREAHDGFGSVEELGEVPGIGEKRLAALRARVRV